MDPKMAQKITPMHGTPTSDKMTSLDHTSTIRIYNKALMNLRRICSREPQIRNILARESIALTLLKNLMRRPNHKIVPFYWSQAFM